MRFLLDTHVLPWSLENSPRLEPIARDLIENEANRPLVSVASFWEMAIKMRLGKLQSPRERSFGELASHLTAKGTEVLGITPAHLNALVPLPLHHRDPFDRLLIAQAIAEGMPILTQDAAFAAYPVQTLPEPL